MKGMGWMTCILLVCCLVPLVGRAADAEGLVSPEGLRLDGFSVSRTQAGVGDVVTVSFSLTNTTNHDIAFSSRYGVFVGARLDSAGEANSRDFGHAFHGRILRPGERIDFRSVKELDEAGEWRLWPAYNIHGHWGPFRWHEILVGVTATSGESFDGEDVPSGSGICPVHGIAMQPVKLRVVYGMPSRREFEEMRAGRLLFPHGRDYILGGCVVRQVKTVQGFLCPECVNARKAWLASQPPRDRLLQDSRASLEEFFALVDSGDIDGALASMGPALLRDSGERLAWSQHLSAIQSIHVLAAEPFNTAGWSDNRQMFKVVLEAHVEDVPDAPIPFFGWHDNPNVRWITMELDSNRHWRVTAIATGP
jgi:hypothetical protein